MVNEYLCCYQFYEYCMYHFVYLVSFSFNGLVQRLMKI